MSSEEARMKVIERIGETIDTFKACERKWVEEELGTGNNPDKPINVMVVRMLIYLETHWQEAEKELLALESQFRKLVPAEEKKIFRKKKN